MILTRLLACFVVLVVLCPALVYAQPLFSATQDPFAGSRVFG